MGKQKRSENTYQKINTIFMRDVNNIIMPNANLVMPELEWLRNCKFECTEKIDGTNTRIEVTSDIVYMDDFDPSYDGEEWPLFVTWTVQFKGKTDKANIPPMLLKYLIENLTDDKVLNALGLSRKMYLSDFTINHDNNINWKHEAHQDAIDHKWVKLDGEGHVTTDIDAAKVPNRYTLYGEGYGAGIQKGGYYRKDNAFIGFDVKVNDTYLLRENMEDIFNKLEVPVVPFIGMFTIDEAIEYVKKGFNSRIAEDEHLAEGLVCKCPRGIMTRRGERIVFKVKTCDWDKYYAKYGTYDPVDQIPNEHYNA